jgi:hypothetical protein
MRYYQEGWDKGYQEGYKNGQKDAEKLYDPLYVLSQAKLDVEQMQRRGLPLPTSDLPASLVAQRNKQIEEDPHKPFEEDGVKYCGWTSSDGIVDGCGQEWPCSTVRSREVR